MELQARFERLQDLLEADAANLSLRRQCTDLALQLQRFDDALGIAEQGLAQAPQDDMLLFARSTALIGRQEYHAAREVLTLLLAAHPQNFAVLQNLALCCYCIGNYQEARQHLESLYADGQRDASVVRLLVSSCHHLGLMDRATLIADENKELAKTDAALAGVMAMAYADDDRVPEAAECAALALRVNPRNVDALTVDGTIKLAQGEIPAARAVFESLLAANPNHGRAWIGLGSIALLERDFARADANIQRGIESLSRHVGSWHLLGWTRLMSGNIDAAEQAFDKAMELNRNFSESHGALAAIAAMRGQLDKAKEMIKVAQRLDPNSLSAQFAQSVIAGRLGNTAQAQQIMGEATQMLANMDPEIYRRLLSIAAGGGRRA